MIRVVTAEMLKMRPLLSRSMFRDRAGQFIERHGWDLTVDENGLEFDEYDRMNPIYVVLENNDGEHVASARMMPTTGRTLLNEKFQSSINNEQISDEKIWEVTRFCCSPRIERACDSNAISLRLIWALSIVAQSFKLDSLVACCTAPFIRFMRKINIDVEVIGYQGTTRNRVFGCNWSISEKNISSINKQINNVRSVNACVNREFMLVVENMDGSNQDSNPPLARISHEGLVHRGG